MVSGTREGFKALRALGIGVTPFLLRVLFGWLPKSVTVFYGRRFLRSPVTEVMPGGHARATVEEMRSLAAGCRISIEKSGAAAPAFAELCRAIDNYVPEAEPPLRQPR